MVRVLNTQSMLFEDAADLLSYLHSLDVRLSLAGENLTCSAPKGVLTAELTHALKVRKFELIELL